LGLFVEDAVPKDKSQFLERKRRHNLKGEDTRVGKVEIGLEPFLGVEPVKHREYYSLTFVS
jgi:hypothetical protein